MRLLFSTISKFLGGGIENFFDYFFSRSNTTGGLGTSSSGDDWIPVNGTINVVDGKAKASSIPNNSSPGSSYPMSVVEMATEDNVVRLKDTNQGSAVALWVQSSSDWWMVDVNSVLQTIPGNTNYGITGSNFAAAYQYNIFTNYSFAVQYGQGFQYGTSAGANFGFEYRFTASPFSGVNYSTQSPTFTQLTPNYFPSTPNYSNTVNYSTNRNYSSATNFGFRNNSSTSFSSFRNTPYAAANFRSTTNFAFGFTSGTNFSSSIGYNRTYGFSSSPVFVSGYKFSSTTRAPIGSPFSGTNYGFTTVVQSYPFTAYNTTIVFNSQTVYSSAIGYSTSVNYVPAGSNYGATGTNSETFAFFQYIRLSRSVASVVSTISSALVSTAQTVKSIMVSTSGNTITAKAYSDANLVTQIGSDLVYTPTGITITPQFGIALSRSDYLQSDIIGNEVTIDTV